jgi:hypothetical protein
MALIVPYRSNGGSTAMIERAFSTVGTRAHGRSMLSNPHRSVQPVLPAAPRAFAGLGTWSICADCAAPQVGYDAAKRQPLGALGASAAVTAGKQVYSGVGTGTVVASTATAIGTSVATAIGAGAAAGSVVPIIGTAIGAIVGLLASGILNHKTDPEVGNFNQAISLYKQNPTSVINIANKYLVLAGLFDLQPSQIKGNIPIYKRYGRMGEQRFVTDMVTLIYNAAQTGQITAADTPLTIMSRIVQPWIDSFGYGTMTDNNADMINLILLGMVADYVTGHQKVWSAVGGQYPFTSVPAFALPQLTAPPPTPPANPQATCTAPYVWNGSQCVLPNAPAQTIPSAAGQLSADQSLAAQGWQRSGTDANGHGLYSKSGVAVLYAFINGNLVPTTISTGAVSAAANCAAPYVWNGTQCVLPNNALPPTPPQATATVPSNYSAVGVDAAGNTIYSSPQGVLYSWTGSGMQIFSGQLASGNSAAAQMQAALQNSLAQGQSAQQAAAAALQQAQSAGVAVTPQLQQQVAAQVDATQAAPVQPIAAGLGMGGSLGTAASVVSIVAAVLGLALATARPVKHSGGRPQRRAARG